MNDYVETQRPNKEFHLPSELTDIVYIWRENYELDQQINVKIRESRGKTETMSTTTGRRRDNEVAGANEGRKVDRRKPISTYRKVRSRSNRKSVCHSKGTDR